VKNRVRYDLLSTEKRNPHSARLGRMTPLQIATLMNREDKQVLRAVSAARPSIARGIDVIARSLKNGGRLFFFGAGTSGRLGVVEAAECPPTFGTSPSQVQAVMAGGRSAVFRSKEGAEDSDAAAAQAVRRLVRRNDVVVGIAASGVTPFARSALRAGRKKGARTLLVTCHPDPRQAREADIVIGLRTGPEVLTGSTRLKAGTSCKMVLNMLTTGAMVRLGKVYGHWMVDLQPKSKKLVERGKRLIRELGKVGAPQAERLFKEARRQIKPAILMARRGYDFKEARKALAATGGLLEAAIASKNRNGL
jgi:N-acetylmuramic acid 6-phosphate etherase